VGPGRRDNGVEEFSRRLVNSNEVVERENERVERSGCVGIGADAVQMAQDKEWRG
jgi:hypothetical protein